MQTTPLSASQRDALTTSVGDGYRVQLFESKSERLRVARMLWNSARIRLVCPEAYPVHRDIIEWGVRFSKDRIPEQAVGVDPLTARLMRWVMKSWERVRFFNRYLMGTVAPRIQLDFLPGYLCAAHVLIRPERAPAQLQDWLDLGAAWQRLWLTASLHGLHFQPQMTPVIFRWYARTGRPFSSERQLLQDAEAISEQFEQIAGATADSPFGVFGRVGSGPAPHSRSLRLDLQDLMLTQPGTVQ